MFSLRSQLLNPFATFRGLSLPPGNFLALFTHVACIVPPSFIAFHSIFRCNEASSCYMGCAASPRIIWTSVGAQLQCLLVDLRIVKCLPTSVGADKFKCSTGYCLVLSVFLATVERLFMFLGTCGSCAGMFGISPLSYKISHRLHRVTCGLALLSWFILVVPRKLTGGGHERLFFD